ncbi:MAG: SRPBCC domain-containing protein [Inquilinus limosus]|uniref:SRPBCC domain-containing protein n=1 Tax=Inquilinus limosus TaxID=171674 RepID=A0A952FEW3_9PROT|nr:SRPBCC domain-containing protein [Inquilinus limosus]
MPVKKDESGRRFVEAEVEVPGTPEEVWQAIATGPGVTSWFVPTRMEERVGGSVIANFGPGMDSVATITAWDPPRRFAADSNDMGLGSPAIATEWTVEAKSGGTCVVRVVHAWFADSDDWDAQFEGHEHGWQAFFRILRLYLAHFRGQSGVNLQLMGVASDPTAQAGWAALTERLGIADAVPGEQVQSVAEAPALAGQVERIGPDDHPELLLRLAAPAPGIAHLFALPMGGQVYLPIRLCLFGDRPAAVAAQEEPVWQAWMARHFPMPAQPG